MSRISVPTEDEMTDDDLTQKIIGCAYKVHNTLGPGFLEKVYENALRIELEKLGLRVRHRSLSMSSMRVTWSESITPICGSMSGL